MNAGELPMISKFVTFPSFASRINLFHPWQLLAMSFAQSASERMRKRVDDLFTRNLELKRLRTDNDNETRHWLKLLDKHRDGSCKPYECLWCMSGYSLGDA